MKKGCLFDLDGTLVNSITDLALSTNEVLKLHHLPTHDISQYNMFVGNGVKKLMERIAYYAVIIFIIGALITCLILVMKKIKHKKSDRP